MKKLNKVEIAIYAISLMLVVAGYYNYTSFNGEVKETISDEVKEVQDYANVGDAVLVSTNEFEDIEMENQVEESLSIETVNNENNENIDNDYYINSKLEREKMYASILENYDEILNNNNITELQKNIALNEITKINNTKNAIMIAENLLQTKGFNNCVILVNENSVNIVVNIDGEMSQDKIAVIQNIISREFGVEIQDIHISQK